MATLGEKNKNMHQNGFHALSSCTSASHIHAYLNSIMITAIGKKKSILLQHLPPVSVDIIWEEGSSEFPQCIPPSFPSTRSSRVDDLWPFFSLWLFPLLSQWHIGPKTHVAKCHLTRSKHGGYKYFCTIQRRDRKLFFKSTTSNIDRYAN